MNHRHLQHDELTLAAIDDIIERGTRSAWAELGRAVEKDLIVRSKTQQITNSRIKANPLNQRFAFWNYYVQNLK